MKAFRLLEIVGFVNLRNLQCFSVLICIITSRTSGASGFSVRLQEALLVQMPVQ